MWNPFYYFSLYISFHIRHCILIGFLYLLIHVFAFVDSYWKMILCRSDPICVGIHKSDCVFFGVLACVTVVCTCVIQITENIERARDLKQAAVHS